MDIFNDSVNTVKNLFDVARKKTGEAVSVGKQKIDISSMENKLAKSYTELGRAYFASVKDSDVQDEDLYKYVEDIRKQEEEIKSAKEELYKMQAKRLCPNCGKPIGTDSVFCNFCGQKVEFEE